MKFAKLLVSCIMVIGATANAAYIESCYNSPGEEYADELDYVFLSCLDHNVLAIESMTNLKLEHCLAYQGRVSYFLASCMKDNFKKIEKSTQLQLRTCFEDSDFADCVDSNFQKIKRKLQNRTN